MRFQPKTLPRASSTRAEAAAVDAGSASARGLTPSRREDGSAAIVVLVLMFLILAFAQGNTVTLNSLKRELHLLDQQQLKKYGEAAVTNAVIPTPQRPAAR